MLRASLVVVARSPSIVTEKIFHNYPSVFIKINNGDFQHCAQQCHFQFFSCILGDTNPKKIFKKSKTSCTVFFCDALQHITWKNGYVDGVTSRLGRFGLEYLIYIIATQ